jgi:hypothetical protein
VLTFNFALFRGPSRTTPVTLLGYCCPRFAC